MICITVRNTLGRLRLLPEVRAQVYIFSGGVAHTVLCVSEAEAVGMEADLLSAGGCKLGELS